MSVRDFSTIGDGIADDTAALQAAFNAVLPEGDPVAAAAARRSDPLQELADRVAELEDELDNLRWRIAEEDAQ